MAETRKLHCPHCGELTRNVVNYGLGRGSFFDPALAAQPENDREGDAYRCARCDCTFIVMDEPEHNHAGPPHERFHNVEEYGNPVTP